ncbi:MAG: alpha/beta hydrolase [Pseudomonadota bacterium]
MSSAPLYDDLVKGPEGGRAFWIHSGDGVRLRAAIWPRDTARGTVLCFPGRTEYVEKYAEAAMSFAGADLATATIDWRGQGLADRLCADPLLGHVDHFSDYQKDVAAFRTLAEAQGLPRPWYVIGHSMGGAIALRAVIGGLPVTAAVFSAPMWGIRMTPPLRALAWSLSWSSRRLGLDQTYAPTTSADPYVLTEDLQSNRLTSDPAMWQFMRDMLDRHPELGLGGPSLRWLHEALKECRALMQIPPPDLPALCYAGSEEAIVDTDVMRDRMARWRHGDFLSIPGARHEILMEAPIFRNQTIAAILDTFAPAVQPA